MKNIATLNYVRGKFHACTPGNSLDIVAREKKDKSTEKYYLTEILKNSFFTKTVINGKR